MKKLLIYVFISFLIFQTNQLFSQYYSTKNIVRHSSITGFVKSITNGNIEIIGSSGKEIAQNYLKINYKIFGFKKDISDLHFLESKASHGMQHNTSFQNNITKG